MELSAVIGFVIKHYPQGAYESGDAFLQGSGTIRAIQPFIKSHTSIKSDTEPHTKPAQEP